MRKNIARKDCTVGKENTACRKNNREEKNGKNDCPVERETYCVGKIIRGKLYKRREK